MGLGKRNVECVEYFVWRANGQEPLVLQSGQRRETVSSIRLSKAPSLDVEKYCAFVVCGLKYSLWRILEIYSRYRHEGQVHQSKCFRLSTACWNAVAEGLMRQSVAMEACVKLRALTERPILLVPNPHPSEHVLRPEVENKRCRVCIQNGDHLDIAYRFEQTKRIWEDLSVLVVSQPDSTITQGILISGARSAMQTPMMIVRSLHLEGAISGT